MSLTLQSSLLEPSGSSAIGGAMDWASSTLFGEVAVSLCVIAVACVGFLLLSGRIAFREGLSVVLGCFLLLGAPTIAAGLWSGGNDANLAPPVQEAPPARESLEPAKIDPFRGAWTIGETSEILFA